MTRLLTSICLSVMLALPSMTLPAAAQTPEGCTSIEAVIDTIANADPAERAKTTLIVMTDQPARAFLDEAVRLFGNPPNRDVADVGTLLILHKEGQGALVMLAEGIAVCPPNLMLSEQTFERIMSAIKGITI
ncbi:hypothetical protein RCRUDOLPH_9 [Rhodobacter phage RcRudolph]|nr:hypothetical protein RCRUDOLPH_9 [Rhodobacter phage RcRudolph]